MKTVKVSRYLNCDGILHLLGKYVSGNFDVRELLDTVCMFYEGGKGGANSRILASFHGKAEVNSGTVQLNCSKCLLEMAAVLPIYCVA